MVHFLVKPRLHKTISNWWNEFNHASSSCVTFEVKFYSLCAIIDNSIAINPFKNDQNTEQIPSRTTYIGHPFRSNSRFCCIFSFMNLLFVFFLALVGCAIFLILNFAFFTVRGPNKSSSTKYAACLISPICFALGLDLWSSLEKAGIGSSGFFVILWFYGFFSAETLTKTTATLRMRACLMLYQVVQRFVATFGQKN